MTAFDIAHLKNWEGSVETARVSISAWLVEAYRATFDLPRVDPTDGLPTPQGLHWCVGPPTADTSQLSEDGHAARGGFLPPVPLPRRMWAGGRVAFHDDLRVGDETERVSRVLRVEAKEGRTGPLVFVVVEHRLSTKRGLSVVEEHDIVYRGVEAPAVRPGGQTRAQGAVDATRTIDPSSPLLFRYSALTFNGHKIHYDRRYTMEVEGYPGLVVHGPLQASLLMGLAGELLGRPLRRFEFRATKPLFDIAPFTVAARREGDGATLWCADAQGECTMTASCA
jgi:3-methylfumaryl-CoA hydratase